MTLSLRYQQLPPSDILSVLSTTSILTNTLSNFQTSFMEGLSDVRQYFQQLREDRERDVQTATELCQLMDAQLAKAEAKRKEKTQLRRAENAKKASLVETDKVAGERRILRSKHPKESQKREILSATKSADKFAKAEQVNSRETSVKSVKKSVSKNDGRTTLKKEPQLVQKRGEEESREIHICFRCLKNKKMTLWGSAEPFLLHMRESHSLEPDFELLLSAGNHELPCSHLFFHGRLTCMLRNSDNEVFRKLLWMLHEGRTDAILACGCLTFSPTNRINLGCPLFLSPQEYLSHLNRHHGMVLPTGSTHRAVTRNGVTRVVRVADSDKIFSNPGMAKIKEELRVRYLKDSIITFKRLLVPAAKITLLELVSRSATVQPHCEVYQPLPVCDLCGLTFPNLILARAHCSKECKSGAAPRADFTLQDMLEYLQIQGKYYEQVSAEWMQQLPVGDRQLLNLQLYLLRKFYHCGQCNKWFIGKDKEIRFLTHLYSHPQPPPASFTFSFLLPTHPTTA